MIVKSVRYSEYSGKKEAWHLDEFFLEKINLIVGRNATGKTRTLNLISNLSNLISGDKKLIFKSGDYKIRFSDKSEKIEYFLKYENAKIQKEKFISDRKVLLNRGSRGEGTIHFQERKKRMKFQTPETELAVLARRDSIQHPFIENLYHWGKSTRHFYFGTDLGANHFALSKKAKEDQTINLKAPEMVVSFLKRGIEKYKKKFTNSIINDMRDLGYYIDDIGVTLMPGMRVVPDIAADVLGIYVHEEDLEGNTLQTSISQGMFRALSLIINLNFSILEDPPSTIFIDDIGEGLDYERSTSLIKLLIEKAKKSSFQIIMATNDRFVMNAVPLEYWCVMERKGEQCRVLNYNNSKKLFDDFKFTGLNNFDFLATNFYLTGSNAK
jgi:predicted ATPase